MKACIQRVSRARVVVAGKVVGEIQKGLLVLLGVARGDTQKEMEFVAEKCLGLRIFEDSEGKMNLALGDIAGGILVVSQFTLLGNVKKGKRPNFTEAAPPEKAKEIYHDFCEFVKNAHGSVQKGVFAAKMEIELVNDGPVTIWVEKNQVNSI